MKDGGYVCLDWFNERGNSAGGSGSDPIILLLPGVTGNPSTGHCKVLIRSLVPKWLHIK